jgi:CRP-like cAMP-binding protein
MELHQNQIANFLAREYLFMDLNEEQLKEIARHFQPVRRLKGKMLFKQGNRPGYFYILYQGRVSVSQRNGKQVRQQYSLGPGDFFGEGAMLKGGQRKNTAAVLEDSTLLRMAPADFQWMMKAYPRMRSILEQVNYSRTLASKRDFSWLKERETIFLISRKHQVFLWLSLILPIFLGLLSLAALIAPVIQFGASWTWMALAAGVLGLFAALLWGWWNWANWENDYFVVTNWRVLWLEKVIFLYESRREARLDKVQSNNVTRPFFGRLLDYGSINVNTYTGNVAMQRVTKPGLIAAYVDGLKERAKVISTEDENQAIQQELRQAYDLHIHPEEQDILLVKGPPKKEKKKKPPGYFRESFQTFLLLRYEREGVITYRKHWFVLVRKNLLPTVVLLVLVALVVGLGVEGSLTGIALGGGLCLGSLFLLVIAWITYNYLDWSNDLYQLTPEFIRELERKPLGEELVNSAKLENILSIEHERGNFIRIVLDFGTVTINVGDRQFTFNDVKDPSMVHQEIAGHQDAWNVHKREIEDQRQREKLANWFTTNYDIEPG